MTWVPRLQIYDLDVAKRAKRPPRAEPVPKWPLVLAAVILAVGAASAFAACPPPDQLPTCQVCIEWEAPTQNTNGTPLTDLAGYEIHYGTASRNYEPSPIVIDSPDPVQHDLSDVTQLQLPSGYQGPVWIAMKAYDADGHRSAFSNEISRSLACTIPESPTVRSVILGRA